MKFYKSRSVGLSTAGGEELLASRRWEAAAQRLAAEISGYNLERFGDTQVSQVVRIRASLLIPTAQIILVNQISQMAKGVLARSVMSSSVRVALRTDKRYSR